MIFFFWKWWCIKYIKQILNGLKVVKLLMYIIRKIVLKIVIQNYKLDVKLNLAFIKLGKFIWSIKCRLINNNHHNFQIIIATMFI